MRRLLNNLTPRLRSQKTTLSDRSGLSLGKKLGLGFGTMIALVILMTAIVFVQIGRVNQETERVLSHNVMSVEYAILTQKD